MKTFGNEGTYTNAGDFLMTTWWAVSSNTCGWRLLNTTQAC